MEPVVTDAARRHGLSTDDILHAYRNPIRVNILDDLDMLVGADRRGRLLEIGVVVNRIERVDVIVHAMPAREKFLE